MQDHLTHFVDSYIGHPKRTCIFGELGKCFGQVPITSHERWAIPPESAASLHPWLQLFLLQKKVEEWCRPVFWMVCWYFWDVFSWSKSEKIRPPCSLQNLRRDRLIDPKWKEKTADFLFLILTYISWNTTAQFITVVDAWPQFSLVRLHKNDVQLFWYATCKMPTEDAKMQSHGKKNPTLWIPPGRCSGRAGVV